MAVSFYSKPPINLHNSTPVFNKRIFRAQAGIVLTDEILAILNRPLREGRSETELHKLRSVVNGLKDIHKGLQFIKDALCHVVGYEKVGPNVQVKKQSSETDLSCYYILNGSIEATYMISHGDSNGRKKKISGFYSLQGTGIDCERRDGYEIKYTHIAGDYLGLVSGDGPEYDLPPPDSIRTTEVCEFLRIDRSKFHQAVRTIHSLHVQEIEHFINSGSILRDLPLEQRQRLVSLMARQEYAAGKVIVNQGDFPDHIFFIGKGRCQFFRRVYIKEAKRQELVRLGHIEEGDVFGESSVLDGSPCFCSVSSIGQVRCYLIDKWAIKHDEQLLNLLRKHQHHFYEDSMIQHYIRDSDVWQSYKRNKINELLQTTNKRHIIIDKKHIPEPLAVAVDFGDASRSHSSQSSREREPGEPKNKQPLFIVPRSRRKSSAILQSNAAAVVKAVLLLRRNTEENNKEPLKLPTVKPQPEQQSLIKPNSAPSRYRYVSAAKNDERLRNNSPFPAESHTSVKCGKNIQCSGTSPLDLDNQPKEKQQIAGENIKRPKSVNDMYSSEQSSKCRSKSRGEMAGSGSLNEQKPPVSQKVTFNKGKMKSGLKKGKPLNIAEENTTANKKSKDEQKHVIQDEEKARTSGSGMEKFVSTSGNFIVKEIINTGNPKRLSSPQEYQRFGLSMFAILDNQKDIKNKFGPNPWGVSYAASKWMSRIRKKRLGMLNESDQGSSPVPTPLIVIEEYAPKNRQLSDDEGISSDSERSSEELEFHSEKDSTYTQKMQRRSRSTPSPSLEKLKEEDEEEIEEYEKHEAGKAVKESWYTSIHQARDQSRSYLEQIRKELDVLQHNRKERRRRRGKLQKEGSVTTSEDQLLYNDVKSEEINDECKDNEPDATVDSSESSANQRHRQRKYSTRKRSRTHSTSTAPDNQSFDQGSSKSNGSVRIGRKFSNLQMRNMIGNQGSTGKLSRQEIPLAEEMRTISKHERRRLLLLGKIGL
uniref:Uncharacterized protein LOC116298696 n=1 Tax=Actinia tenebrosa TaxID=6105 RepID=A0A6P8I3F5_ACTTE